MAIKKVLQEIKFDPLSGSDPDHKVNIAYILFKWIHWIWENRRNFKMLAINKLI
jgi:hypothetical protein